jgi:hypothetical protein
MVRSLAVRGFAEALSSNIAGITAEREIKR